MKLKSLLVAVLFFVVVSGVVFAGGTTSNSGTRVNSEYVGNSGGVAYTVYQTFQVAAGQLSEITVAFVENNNSPTGTVTWGIYATSGTTLTTLLQSGTFTPTPSATNTISVSSGITLSAATTYAVRFAPTTAQSTNNTFKVKETADSYALGQAVVCTATCGPISADLEFSITTVDATATPTATYTPTSTAMPSATTTPLGTSDWCYTYNLRTNSQGATIDYGSWEPGTGFKTESYGGGEGGTPPPTNEVVSISFERVGMVVPTAARVTLRRGTFTIGETIAVSAYANVFGLLMPDEPNPINFEMGTEDIYAYLPLYPIYSGQGDTTFTVSVIASREIDIQSVEVFGVGVNPFPYNSCGESTPTPTAPVSTPDCSILTPGPTNTPTVAPTRVSSATELYFDDLNGGLGPWSAVWEGSHDGSKMVQLEDWDGAGIYVNFPSPVNIRYWSVRYTASGTGHVRGLYLQYADLSYSWDFPVNLLGGGSGVETQFVTYDNITRFGWEVAGTTSYTGYTGDDFYIEFDWVTPPTSTPDMTPTTPPGCGTPTPTFTPSLVFTPLAVTATPSPSLTPSQTPFPVIAPTRTFTPTAGASPTSTITRTPRPTLTVPAGMTATASAEPFDTTAEPFHAGGETGDTGGNILGFTSNFWERSRGWADNLTSGVRRITEGWANAPITAPPIVPRCRTEPLANELCALWYILSFTVLGGQGGHLINVASLAVIDTYFLFLYVRFVRAIIARAREIHG